MEALIAITILGAVFVTMGIIVEIKTKDDDIMENRKRTVKKKK